MNEITGRPAGPFIDRDFVRRNAEPENPDRGFATLLHGALGNVNQMQIDADRAVTGILNGEMDNIHQVLIKAEEAQISLQLTTQVVNKVLQAYQEISRMQI